MQSDKFYNTIARFYDAENAAMTDDLPLYRTLAADVGDPVLDVGCGTGRVMLHLAQAGHRVVGVDYAAAMLQRGQRKLDAAPHTLRQRVLFVQGDVLQAAFDNCFRLIVVPYNGFMHFPTQAGQLQALRRFHTLLHDDGLLVLDIPNAGEDFGTQDEHGLALERMFTEPESGHLVMQQAISTLDRVAQRLQITWVYDEIAADGTLRRTLAPLVLRYVFPGEMDLMLAAAGLRKVAVYGDYDEAAFAEGCPRMIVVAEKDGTA
jgi:SAM-dependent methyltransferase